MNDELQDRRINFLETFHSRAEKQRDDDIACPHPFSSGDLSSPWYYYDRLVRGYQWDFLEDMDSWVSRPVKNMAAIAVESYTTMLTDSHPTVIVQPREESDTELADLIRAGVNYWWEKEYMPEKLTLAVKASRMFGIGWLYTYHDPDKGECCKFVHPESVLVDANATVDDFDPQGIEYEYLTTVGELKSRFPDHDFDDFQVGWRPGINQANRVQYKRYADNENPNASTPVYELWYKDSSWEDFESETLISGKKVKGQKKKYPGGRKLVIAGDQVLEDIPNPYDHGEFPFTPVHAYPVPGRFYGIGDVQHLMNIQLMRNRMSQFLFDQTVKSGGGWVLVGRRSGIDAESLSNAPMQIVPCEDVNHFRLERPLPPSRHVFDYIAMLDKDADDVMGLHDISRGAFVPGNKTAQEIAVLSESDRTRVRMASRWLTWALERVGRQLVSNLAQWNDWRWFVRIGDSQAAVELKGDDLRKKGDDGKLTKEKLQFDLSFADNSTLPPSQQQSYERVDRLLAWQVLTPEDILKYGIVDIPHREEILADREAAMQQAPPPDAGMGGMPPDMAAMMGGGMPPVGAVPPMAQTPPMPPMEMMPPPDQMQLSPTDIAPDPNQVGAIVQMMAEQTGLPVEQVIELLAQGGM